ncbi:hypothetical protein [Ferrimonas marina]|uniref:Uncharacterized protein n=1 Tax=Ferrimonas marina TaxID=299255 RepID=A0A1M5S7H3_9GAMM|nr:hypothetical protein [Ferrimonas marina]SHH34572.1 hypothetical protein SAMN02745129_1902 [Ferrimonas marina]
MQSRAHPCRFYPAWSSQGAAVLLLLGLVASPQLRAESELELEQELSRQASPLSGAATLSYFRNSYDASAYAAYQAVTVDGSLRYRQDWGQLRLTFGGEQELLHGEQSSWFDPLLEYRTPTWALSDSLSWQGGVGVYLPASRTSRKDRLEYAPQARAYLFWRPEGDWQFYLSPRYRYNQYRYQTAGEQVLTEHQASVAVDALWHFRPDWYLDVNGSLGWARNFYGRSLDTRFTASEELGWEVTPHWSLALGHSNAGRFYDPEYGPGQGFELYDRRSSTFYLATTFSF